MHSIKYLITTFIFATPIYSSMASSQLPINNSSMESNDAERVGPSPQGWESLAGRFRTLDASAFGYSDNQLGLKGTRLAFSTQSESIVGDGIQQVLKGCKAYDNTTYTLTVGIGERNFLTRFSGVTLQLCLVDGTVLGSREFGKSDIAPLFKEPGGAHEVVDVAVDFRLGDVENTQDLKIVILAGGGVDGGSDGRQSVDIDQVSLSSSVGHYRQSGAKSSGSTILSVGGVKLNIESTE